MLTKLLENLKRHCTKTPKDFLTISTITTLTTILFIAREIPVLTPLTITQNTAIFYILFTLLGTGATLWTWKKYEKESLYKKYKTLLTTFAPTALIMFYGILISENFHY
ncbi:MAG: hypothetical protein KC736_03045, partial [Candidatus Moranbacteria bacterium]|nr:hypothetical protein [Candidatus Moranbacteria bacterium]